MAKSTVRSLEEDYNKTLLQIQSYNETFNKMQDENQELQNNLNMLLKKQEHEQAYKSQIEGIKADMLETKKNEFDKINQIFCNLKTNNISINKLISQSSKSIHMATQSTQENYPLKIQKESNFSQNQLFNY